MNNKLFLCLSMLVIATSVLASERGHAEGDSEKDRQAVVGHDNRVVSGSFDNPLKVWDINTGECLQKLTGHTNSVNRIEGRSEDRQPEEDQGRRLIVVDDSDTVADPSHPSGDSDRSDESRYCVKEATLRRILMEVDRMEADGAAAHRPPSVDGDQKAVGTDGLRILDTNLEHKLP